MIVFYKINKKKKYIRYKFNQYKNWLTQVYITLDILSNFNISWLII